MGRSVDKCKGEVQNWERDAKTWIENREWKRETGISLGEMVAGAGGLLGRLADYSCSTSYARFPLG
jgi:hypothetical protein